MKSSEVIKEIKRRGGNQVRQKGSHIRVKCACATYASTVPESSEIPLGTLKAIQRDLAPCANFGAGWLGV